MKLLAVFYLLPVAFAAPTPALVDSAGNVIGSLVAPIIQPGSTHLITDGYVVKLKDGSSTAALESTLALLSGNAAYVYNSDNFKGFSMSLDSAGLALLQSLDIIDFIEQDAIFKSTKSATQPNAPWGLARISHKSKGSTTYVYDETAGEGTCSYVVDTGIYTAHQDFGGRATWLANFVDTNNIDGAGHGSHVAGTIGGTTYGVAKKTKLYSVKVLDSSGSGKTSGIIAGLNYVANDVKTRSCPNGTVVNLSLGGGFSNSLNAAARALVNAGVFVSVAAGNDNAEASGYSPASESSVCTVGSTTGTDDKSGFSNYGPMVDVLAPGSFILSVGTSSPSASFTMSGTSMSSSHVAGLAAYFLSLSGKKTPAELCDYIKRMANMDMATGFSTDTVNQIAFNGNPLG